MEQLRAALAGPHGVATIVTWTIAGAAVLIALAHALRRRPLGARWSRGTPVAAFAGWWLLACLGQVRTRTGLVLFALGGSITTLALVVAALVVDPVLADHFLAVAYLPVLAAASLLELQRTWSERPRRRRPARTMTTTSQ